MEYQREDEGLQSLTGTVERVVFRNEENGWTVLELEAEDELHKVVGVLPSVNVGERLRLLGAWVEHASFGHQFRAEHCESQLPTNAAAILRYLSSGAVKGVRLRHRCAHRGEVRGGDPEHPGAGSPPPGRNPGHQPGQGQENRGGFRLPVRPAGGHDDLFPLWTDPQRGQLRCWKKWGAATIKKIRDNPYLLCSTACTSGSSGRIKSAWP